MSAILIDPATLHDHLGQYRIFDCRFSLADPAHGQTQYHAAHIPGAMHLDMERDLSGHKTATSGRHPLPRRKDLNRCLRRAGVNQDSAVVVYDANRLAGAARAWWVLRYFGLHNVRVLDGGFGAWRSAGLPTHAGAEPLPAPGNVALSTPDTHRTVNRDEVLAALADASRIIVDAREARRFAGLEEPIDPVAGRIPGAVNIPWQQVTSEDGMVRRADVLRALWTDAHANDDPIVYCGSGVTASVLLLSRVLAGLDEGRLYAGSWSEWCAYESSPIETDAAWPHRPD